MDDRQRELLQAANKAAIRAYAPYSGFRVGAAVDTELGVFTGVNVENASFGLGLCAERAALAAAVAAGAGTFRGVAVYCLDAEPGPDGVVAESSASPCGACRQWLAELAPGAWVVTNAGGPYSVDGLLPLGFA